MSFSIEINRDANYYNNKIINDYDGLVRNANITPQEINRGFRDKNRILKIDKTEFTEYTIL